MRYLKDLFIKLFFICLLVDSSQLYAFDIKGIEIAKKISKEQIVNTLNIKCTETRGTGMMCGGKSTLAGREVEYFLIANQDYVLESFGAYFDPDDFEAIRDALLSKFGKPNRQTTEVLQNAMGATFKQENVFWEDSVEKTTASILKYNKKISEGIFTMFSPWFSRSNSGATQKGEDDI